MSQSRVIVTGIVQGVGFRPFVYRTAKKHGLNGYIRNAGNSVELLLDGDERNIQDFLERLRWEHPPMADIQGITVIDTETGERFEDFVILKSRGDTEGNSIIPPDIAVCKSCVKDIFDKTNRRYLYPFTVCMDCGPRFTTIETFPYDREKTTMRDFPMCRACAHEYLDVEDRKFRAEPTCCPDCGPEYELYRDEEKLDVPDPIKEAVDAIENGKIVAIKGVGGTHLVTRTTEDEPILKIRTILNRRYKPFAVMARDIDTAAKFAYINRIEKGLLESFRRPIVALRKRAGAGISGHIAPGLDNIGVMLPYSGIHHLLFYYSKEPAFVMTSANIPGEPMAINRDEILSLGAEYSLVHNIRIKNRCDDSVMKVVADREVFLRRSRGFVPRPVELRRESIKNILALGAELDVTACILRGRRAFLSQYVGNTTRLKTLEYLDDAIHNLMEINRVGSIDVVAVDLHPHFNTSRLGEELANRFDARFIRCQHHHAHIASLMAENGIDRIVGVASDGAGYGLDGTVWGGEVFAVENGIENDFERTGSLMPQFMPGGDLAVRYPSRMVAGILSRKYPADELRDVLIGIRGFRNEEEIDVVLRQIERRFNTPVTSSTGRVLDAISAVLGICHERTYEGEPALRLEAFASKGEAKVEIPVVIKEIDNRFVLDTTELLDAVLLAREKYRYEDIAASAQKALAEGLAEIAIQAARMRGIDSTGISGGVAYNDAIVRYMKEKALEEGFGFFTQNKAPCGDGGISLGQAALAAFNL
ncbi:(NiFe) hydrogenase maturation protein HypF [Candidatus Methanoperedens nitroreducens]|uniref:Carbamoyltransferase n=1 Tax=Candidatus Methanoperedens nitratireducens TaxID=1392998 RepID=A0A062V713_9EURY|nr:carbamoyltransferase HypF [Candidatus Methanoperedens nitroreducens]KCZ73102.1 (NiFe) hydrogenase maturation protein HypF [Candidatus Methanoperedens nitroreducens]MDJ1422952.1 carbamoyltransferase HypF [Candidatus Methanoperedens sp.]